MRNISKHVSKRQNTNRGFMALLPAILVGAFLLYISSLTTSNSFSYIQSKTLQMNRGMAQQNAFGCAIWLQSYSDKIEKVKTVNSSVGNTDLLVVGIDSGQADCGLDGGGLVRSHGLYSGIGFYQNFNFPLADLYLGSI